jgi:hypothetical protein
MVIIQKLLGVGVIVGAIMFFLNDSVLLGLLSLVLGGALFNGARQGKWLCFHSGGYTDGDPGSMDGEITHPSDVVDDHAGSGGADGEN